MSWEELAKFVASLYSLVMLALGPSIVSGLPRTPPLQTASDFSGVEGSGELVSAGGEGGEGSSGVKEVCMLQAAGGGGGNGLLLGVERGGRLFVGGVGNLQLVIGEIK